MKIIMVCLGNICRSPMAEGILRYKSREAGLPITTDSAGTSRNHIGESPDRRAVRCLNEYGIDISDLRARQFVREDYDRFDRIYAMDESNLEDILRLSRNAADREKVRLFLDLIHPGKGLSVPDPWFGDESGFHEVYQLLNPACDKLIADLQKTL